MRLCEYRSLLTVVLSLSLALPARSGVTCYEMAFGHPPNANVHPLKVTMLIPRLPAPEVGANFSADFQAFVKACCVKNPAQRPDIPTLLKMPFVAKAPSIASKALTWD